MKAHATLSARAPDAAKTLEVNFQFQRRKHLTGEEGERESRWVETPDVFRDELERSVAVGFDYAESAKK